MGNARLHETDKVLTRERLLALRAAARAAGRRVVHCHGCFDIVHPGHIRHLRHAKAQGDILLVSITGDTLMNKGTGRPLIPQELRAENLAALDFVNWVYVEPRPTAADLLAEVQPDVYVKGREYETNNDPRFRAERDIVERHGGRVVFSSGEVVFSSTALIAAMEQSVDPFHKRLTQLTRETDLQAGVLGELVGSFAGLRVLVVGETILDTYVMCDLGTVMTLRPLERRQYDGGAAVIARHLAAMGARPVLVTGLPESDESEALRRRLLAQGIELREIRVSTPIPEKQRFLVGAQKVMKLDLVEPAVLDAAQQQRVVGLAQEAADAGCHAAILADFGLGMMTPATLTRLCKGLRERVGVLSGDVSGRRSSLLAMTDMDVVCPSEAELRDSLRLYGEGLSLAAWKLLEETRTRSAIVTMGADGLIAFDRLPEGSVQGANDGAWQTRLRADHVPALCPLALDPLGCGDSLLSAATLALAAGGTIAQAAFLGACAAGSQVQRLGNIPISSTDLRQMVSRVHAAHLVYAPSEMIEMRAPALRAS